MKTNVPIELTEPELRTLANMIDGKTTKRTATRKEIVELCQRHIGGLVVEEAVKKVKLPPPGSNRSDLYRIDPEDRELLRGKSDGYVFGWNKVKRGVA